MSTGLEMQVLLPVVQAPFRVYWAYNPLLVREYLQPPIVADRSIFPNEATFLNAVASFGNAYPFFEQHSTVPLHHRPDVLTAARPCCNMLVSKQIQGVSA